MYLWKIYIWKDFKGVLLNTNLPQIFMEKKNVIIPFYSKWIHEFSIKLFQYFIPRTVVGHLSTSMLEGAYFFYFYFLNLYLYGLDLLHQYTNKGGIHVYILISHHLFFFFWVNHILGLNYSHPMILYIWWWPDGAKLAFDWVIKHRQIGVPYLMLSFLFVVLDC